MPYKDLQCSASRQNYNKNTQIPPRQLSGNVDVFTILKFFLIEDFCDLNMVNVWFFFFYLVCDGSFCEVSMY